MSAELSSFFEGLLIEFIAVLIGVIIGSVLYHLKTRARKIIIKENTMTKLVEDVDDLQKLAVLQAQMIDNTTKRLHPKEATHLESSRMLD